MHILLYDYNNLDATMITENGGIQKVFDLFYERLFKRCFSRSALGKKIKLI